MSKKPDKHELGRAKGSRLARRARSFKEDILGKIHQMRTPSRAASPQQPHKARPRARDTDQLDAPPPAGPVSPAGSPSKGDSQVNNDMKQISNALRYFQDSVEKNTLGHLPGSASIVLEYVLHLISLLKKDLINDQSSVLISTTNQVYQSLSRFIEWADDVMLNRERATMEGVNQVVQSLQDSIKGLIDVSQKQSQNKDKGKHVGTTTPNGVYSTKADNSSHRNSLPELPLTPRERQILESTRIPDNNGAAAVVAAAAAPAAAAQGPLCHSASSDSILSSALRPDFPPPKPPLPHLTPPR